MNQPPTRIFLIGFMGSGKSHTGRQLAQRLGYRFIDLDDWIEEQAGMDITSIFALEGEEGFRGRERRALHDMEKLEQIVVACGGGAPCFFDNMAWMNQWGLTIYLQAPAHILAERLRPGRAHRPLLAQLSEADFLEFIEKKLTERAPVYARAQLIIHQENAVGDIALELERKIRG